MWKSFEGCSREGIDGFGVLWRLNGGIFGRVNEIQMKESSFQTAMTFFIRQFMTDYLT